MEYRLSTPISESETRELRVGDILYVNGILVTARDEAHRRALEMLDGGNALPVDLEGIGIFHCGPIVKKEGDEWKVVAAGPTTSARLEVFEDRFIETFRPALIIGKGGMGDRTAKACATYSCAYGVFTGGAALLGARRIVRVKDVFWLEELGMPECLWVFEVDRFGPMIVTIDTHGGNMTKDIMQRATVRKEQIIAER